MKICLFELPWDRGFQHPVSEMINDASVGFFSVQILINFTFSLPVKNSCILFASCLPERNITHLLALKEHIIIKLFFLPHEAKWSLCFFVLVLFQTVCLFQCLGVGTSFKSYCHQFICRVSYSASLFPSCETMFGMIIGLQFRTKFCSLTWQLI